MSSISLFEETPGAYDNKDDLFCTFSPKLQQMCLVNLPTFQFIYARSIYLQNIRYIASKVFLRRQYPISYLTFSIK